MDTNGNSKELLLKDLCSRLPYGVNVRYKSVEGEGDIKLGYGNLVYVSELRRGWVMKECKPYLRPLSSMTEEEKKELKSSTCPFGTGYFNEKYLICLMNHYGEQISYEFMSGILDWLNKKMFDYRGLIPMGLALEATEGMYPTH